MTPATCKQSLQVRRALARCHRERRKACRYLRKGGPEALDALMGWAVDYGVVKPYWGMVRDRLDHRNLNEVMPNPTCELIAEWIAAELQSRLGKLGPARRVTVSRIELRETERCGVVWRR